MRMFCGRNRGGTWGCIWGIIRIGCRGCTRGGTFGDTVSGTWGSTSVLRVVLVGIPKTATDRFLSSLYTGFNAVNYIFKSTERRILFEYYHKPNMNTNIFG